MKHLALVFSLTLATMLSASAQWIERTYDMTSNGGGWYGIWLAGDATYTTVDEIFKAYPVDQVWRWNPNPDGAQFSADITTLETDTTEWSVWKSDGSETGLSRMIGNSAYLIHTTSPTSITIKQSLLAPSDEWLITGSNLLGFPAKSGANINSYFASFIVNGKTGLPSGTKIYSYVGGNLSASNPIQINTTSTSSVKTLDPTKAYWFSVPAVSDFTGAVEYEVPAGALSYGRTVNTITLGITNRSTSNLTLTFSTALSATPPAGEPGITGPVPLNVSTTDTSGNVTLTPISGYSVSVKAYSVSVPGSGRVSLDIAVDRSGLTGSASNLYASILGITDSANLTDVKLGASAQPTSYAGLWLCDVQVTGVGDNQGGATPTATSRAFPVQFLVHQGASGAPVILREVFLGQLTSGAVGLAQSESSVQPSGTSTIEPARFYSPMLPANNPTISGSGNLGSGTNSWEFTLSYDDPVNPFVHTYHPDHDNRDAKLNSVGAGVESYNVKRKCDFTFTNAAGSTSLSGTYAETLTGLNSEPIHVSGTFIMRRLSEIETLNQ